MGAKIWKVTKLILVGLLALVVLLLGSGLSYRAWYQHQAAKMLAITTPNGIDEAMFVPIRGTLQWITVRGRDRNNPVILMIHGGPGVTHSGFAVSFVPWEKDFTIVQWDQPGAGRTFEQEGDRFPPDLTIESMARDGVSVAEFLETHLHKDRIIILGWSWGSILGVHMVQARPDLFAAYVGTGQIVKMQAGEAIVYSDVLLRRDEWETAAQFKSLNPLDRLPTRRRLHSALSGSGPLCSPATNPQSLRSPNSRCWRLELRFAMRGAPCTELSQARTISSARPWRVK